MSTKEKLYDEQNNEQKLRTTTQALPGTPLLWAGFTQSGLLAFSVSEQKSLEDKLNEHRPPLTPAYNVLK